jgi:hypothetical protein
MINRRLALSLLSLDGDFTPGQLKEAFRREAKRWHPDRNKSPDASQQFQLRLDAYNYLLENKGKVERRPVAGIKQRFHRPIVDENSETYQKIKKVTSIIFGDRKVQEVESTFKSTQRSLDEIFDLLGIEKE